MRPDRFPPHDCDNDGLDFSDVGIDVDDLYVTIQSGDLAPFANWSRPRWLHDHDPSRPSHGVSLPSRVWWDRAPDDDETIPQRLIRMLDDDEAARVIEDIECEAEAIKAGLRLDRLQKQ